MVSLTFHESDFERSASWDFFAAHHGKSPCDGIGGTTKRCLTRESLSRPVDGHILTAKQAYDYCHANITGIEYHYMSSEYVDQKRTFMINKRNVLGDTIPGTTKYHHFQPIRIGTVGFKMISEDTVSSNHNFFIRKTHTPLPQVEVSPQCYIGCVYDDKWWVGMVVEIEDNKFKVQFMHQKGLIPNKGFYWPKRDDVCWIDVKDILLVLSTPELSSRSARTYSIGVNEQKTVQGIFDNHQNVVAAN